MLPVPVADPLIPAASPRLTSPVTEIEPVMVPALEAEILHSTLAVMVGAGGFGSLSGGGNSGELPDGEGGGYIGSGVFR